MKDSIIIVVIKVAVGLYSVCFFVVSYRADRQLENKPYFEDLLIPSFSEKQRTNFPGLLGVVKKGHPQQLTNKLGSKIEHT